MKHFHIKKLLKALKMMKEILKQMELQKLQEIHHLLHQVVLQDYKLILIHHKAK